MGKAKIKKEEEKKIESSIGCGDNCSCEKESKAVQLKKALFYDQERKRLSRTALMSFVFFALAVITTITGLVLGVMGKEIPNNFLVFVSSLVGGSFLNYSFGKTLDKGKG